MEIILIDKITDVSKGKRKDGTGWALSTFEGIADGLHVKAKTFYPIIEGHTYEGKVVEPSNSRWLPTFDVSEEVVQREEKPKPKTTDISCGNCKHREPIQGLATDMCRKYNQKVFGRPQCCIKENGKEEKPASPPSSITSTSGDIDITYKTPVSLHDWLYAIELAVRLYERDTKQAIKYTDIIDTAKKFCQMP